MAEMLKLAEQYAIVAEAERPPTPVRVLKHGDSFAVFDPHGDIVPAQPASKGSTTRARGFFRNSSCCWPTGSRCS